MGRVFVVSTILRASVYYLFVCLRRLVFDCGLEFGWLFVMCMCNEDCLFPMDYRHLLKSMVLVSFGNRLIKLD